MEELNKKLRELRNQYTGERLDKGSIQSNPFSQFKIWMENAVAANIAEPTAMILATADNNGVPSLRTVLLKDFTEKGFVFYTNYNSRKGKQINENPHGSLLFFWPTLHRQIRIEGILEKTDPSESEKYFHERPFESQVSAWVSPQSSPIESRTVLEEKFVEIETKYQGSEIPYPSFWGGYCLKPILFEFWQGQANRLHDRVQYDFNYDSKNWNSVLLAP